MFCITTEHKSSWDTFYLFIAKILPIMYTIVNNSLMKLWCLSACKKRTPFLTSFLRYCKDIPNLLLWVLWECLIMPINTDSITFKQTLKPKELKLTYGKLWYVYPHAKNQLHLQRFFENSKDIGNFLFWELWEYLIIPIKFVVSICSKLSCLSACEKSTSSPILFWRYSKDMQISYFGSFGYTWLCKPKLIVSTCRRLQCLSACQQ